MQERIRGRERRRRELIDPMRRETHVHRQIYGDKINLMNLPRHTAQLQHSP